MPPWLITTSGLLIFCGVMGKSAQFPLHVWLPDAMEGPTPVSALLHSATMVAAGVYLMTRIFPFFAASATTMTVILAISTITLILSSTIGMVATDIKQVWAYSTVSQLGFMAMGLAAAALASGTLFAGYYHLTTHAAFKALLFLCSGVFIHHFGTNDFFTMATNGGRKLLIPMACITIAALALAGHLPLRRVLQQGTGPDGPGPSGQQDLAGPGPLRRLPDGLLRLPGDLRHALPQAPGSLRQGPRPYCPG